MLSIADAVPHCTIAIEEGESVPHSGGLAPSVCAATAVPSVALPVSPQRDEKSISPPISNETSAAAVSPPVVPVAPSAGAIGSFFGSYAAFAASGFFSQSGALISGLLRSAVGVSLSKKMLSKSHIGNI
jgi:hypothetical protein